MNASLRSLLFVPASRGDRFGKALTSGADAVCIDLEDSVAVAQKVAAREAAAALLAADRSDAPRVGVRVNSLDGAWGPQDASALGPRSDFLMCPKVERPEPVADLARRLPGLPIWLLIETAGGLLRAQELVTAARTIQGVLFGAFDYAADVGCALDWEPLLYARSHLATVCAMAGIQLLDAPSGDLADARGLTAETARGRALGFTGRACIHPAQVAPVNSVFTPTAEEIADARRVLAAFDEAEGNAAQLNGKLIEQPVALAARRVLARAGVAQ